MARLRVVRRVRSSDAEEEERHFNDDTHPTITRKRRRLPPRPWYWIVGRILMLLLVWMGLTTTTWDDSPSDGVRVGRLVSWILVGFGLVPPSLRVKKTRTTVENKRRVRHRHTHHHNTQTRPMPTMTTRLPEHWTRNHDEGLSSLEISQLRQGHDLPYLWNHFSICRSRQRPTPQPPHNSSTSLRHAAVQWLYHVLHQHQHGPARTLDVSNLSVTCPNTTKYLVVALGPFGLGSTLYQTALPALLYGLLYDRVVLFLNGGPTGGPLSVSWAMASCPRRDVQCSLLPASPCVLTTEALSQHSVLVTPHHVVNQTLAVPTHYHEAPIWILSSFQLLVHHRIPLGGRLWERVQNKARQYNVQVSPQIQEFVAQNLQDLDSLPDHSTSLPGVRSSVLHLAALIYVLRPNAKLRQALETPLQEATQSSYVLGMPLRASDKCTSGESQCLDVNLYLELAQQKISQQQSKSHIDKNNRTNVVLVTTESARLLEQVQQLYHSQQNNPSFSLRTNPADVFLPNGGNPLEWSATADDVLQSSLTSLVLQVQYPNHVLGDCCSNFHNVILDLRYAGCGSHFEGTCLQQEDDPKFRPCCAWSRNPECVAAKRNASTAS